MAVHALLLPWSAQGHLTPVMQLAQLLARQPHFLTTLVLSARVKARLQSVSSPLPQQPNINVQVISDGLNPDPSYTPSFAELLASIPIMQQSLENLVEDLMASPHPITCLISGTFCFWSQPVACKFDIPRAELWSSPAFIYCIGFYYDRLLSEGLVPFKGQWDETITCIPGVPPIKASDFIKELLPSVEEVQADAEKVSKLLNHVKQTYGSARDQFRILVNSIYDLESQAFDALCEDQIPACAIGPLFLHNMNIDDVDQPFKQPRTSLYREDHVCLQWLDSKAPESTLYIAFGSDSRMEKHDLQELAYGLEASGHAFLWVIRPGSVLGDMSLDEVLPEGFKERVCERGLVVSWVSQTDVLAHVATGGFLSHCGWNSTLETLWFGVPILAWPQRADQGVNKKYIEEEWKVGIAIEKNEEGKFSRITMEKAVRSLMEGEEGSHVREKVKEVKELMCKAIQGGSSQRNFDQFIQDLRSLDTAQDSKKS
eukprot:c43426_g1_i1 orf=89-1543(+)